MRSTALTVTSPTHSPDSASIERDQSKLASSPGFLSLVPAITVQVGQERVTLNSAGHDLIQSRKKGNAKILAVQTSPDHRATRNRTDSEDAGYCSDDASPPPSATSSGSGSSGSSIWYVPTPPTVAAKSRTIAEKSATPASEGTSHSHIGGTADDIPYIDAEDDVPKSEASQPSAEHAAPPRPQRQHLIPSRWLFAQGDDNWPLGPAPTPPLPKPGNLGAQSVQPSATVAAMVTGENSNFVFNPRPREETPSQPWYSGIGSFVAAQLNRLRDGFNAMREMIFPASAQTNPPAAANDTYATANRSIPQTPEEIAVTTLDIGLNIAKSGRKDVQKVAGMDEFRGLKFRGLTSMYDLLDPRNNAFKTGPAVGTTAPSAQEQSKPAAQEAFRDVLTQAEQDAYWDAQKVLKPLGHTLGNGSRAINVLEDPADFAAFQKQVLDAFDISIVAMEKVKAALSPETETSPA